MKKVKITGKKKSQIVSVNDPGAKENWALVKIIVAPMCTEYKSFIAGTLVECLGHEAAGEVVEAPSDADVKVGDRVVVMPQYPCGNCELCLSGDYIYCENGYDLCVNATKRRGQVAFIGESNKLTLDVSNQIIRKGLVINGI